MPSVVQLVYFKCSQIAAMNANAFDTDTQTGELCWVSIAYFAALNQREFTKIEGKYLKI